MFGAFIEVSHSRPWLVQDAFLAELNQNIVALRKSPSDYTEVFAGSVISEARGWSNEYV